MVLYITDEAHKDYLTFVEEDVQVRVYREPDMLTKVRKELPYISSVSAVIVDGTGIDMTTWPAAVELLHTMLPVPVLLIEESGRAETWVQCDGYVAMNRANKDIKEEIKNWLNGDLSRPRTWIGVAGLTPSAGTTSLAMHLAQYVHLAGQPVAVTETGCSFPAMAEAYGWDNVETNVWNWGGVYYNSKQIDENIRYTVFDFGIIGEKKLAMLDRCEIKILVVEGKLYHLQALNRVLKNLRNLSGKLQLVFTFTPDADKAWLRKQYTSDWISIWFAPVEVDLFKTSFNYGELVKGYVVTPVTDKKKQPVRKKSRSWTADIKARWNQIPKKVWIPAAGGAGILLLFLFGMVLMLQKGVPEDQEPLSIAVNAHESMEDTGRLNISGGDDTGIPPVTEQEAGTQNPETSQTEEHVKKGQDKTIAGTEAPQTETPEAQTGTQPEGAGDTAAPATEAPATEQPVGVDVSGYNGQIYAGDEVIAIMNQLNGQAVALHLVSGTLDGWYNAYADGSAAAGVGDGTAQVNPEYSYICQVRQDTGYPVVEFIQQ